MGAGAELAGFVILDGLGQTCPELDWLIVAKPYQGYGVAQALMKTALACIAPDKPIQLGVIYYNERAQRF
ncbi:GNAT family N-acetyltransferase [Crenobacter sp. SG2305]|nr:GNAT family N-acetyltransferase [Crenobacter sp. SG2305]MDN0081901.1 GNAT family N-acetyltransferase [Crenobacter sp. SG2305]